MPGSQYPVIFFSFLRNINDTSGNARTTCNVPVISRMSPNEFSNTAKVLPINTTYITLITILHDVGKSLMYGKIKKGVYYFELSMLTSDTKYGRKRKGGIVRWKINKSNLIIWTSPPEARILISSFPLICVQPWNCSAAATESILPPAHSFTQPDAGHCWHVKLLASPT